MNPVVFDDSKVALPGSLKRIQSVNKHNRAERTSSDISCKKTNAPSLELTYFFMQDAEFPARLLQVNSSVFPDSKNEEICGR